MRENLDTAYSRITDVYAAEESSRHIRRFAAGGKYAILAHANIEPAVAPELLQDL